MVRWPEKRRLILSLPNHPKNGEHPDDPTDTTHR